MNTRRGGVVASAGFYPITQMYVVAVAVSVALINMWISLTGAIVVLGVAAVAAVMAVMLRELRTVHRVMNGQRVELLDRIDLLTESLLNHDVRVPTESAGTKQIRAETAEVEL